MTNVYDIKTKAAALLTSISSPKLHLLRALLGEKQNSSLLQQHFTFSHLNPKKVLVGSYGGESSE